MMAIGLVGLGAATVGIVGVDATFAEVSERRGTSFGNSGHYGYGAATAVSDATRVVTYAQGDRVDVAQLGVQGAPTTFTPTDFPGGTATNAGSNGESFGHSVDVDVIDGSDIIVGEPQFTSSGSNNEGRVWVTTYDPSTRAIGTPAALTFPAGPRNCGDRVVIRGDVAVVRCLAADNVSGHEIYIFERDSSNAWQRVLNKSTPATPADNNMYGNTIGVVLSSSGKYIVAISDHLGNNEDGQVEMCTRDTTTTTALGTTTNTGAWSCTQVLSPSSTAVVPPGGSTGSVSFGRYFCMDDVYMMIGAPGDAANGADGSYYVYKRDSNDVYQDESQQLTITEGSPVHCTLKGDYLAVLSINGVSSNDAFYVYEKDSSDAWNEKLLLHDPDCSMAWKYTDNNIAFAINDDVTSDVGTDYIRLEAGCHTYANPNVARPTSYPQYRETGAVFTFNLEEIPSGGPDGGAGSGSKSDDLSDDEIAGIAVGCVAFIALLVVFVCIRRRRNSSANQPAYVVTTPAPASGRQQQQQPQVIVLQS